MQRFSIFCLCILLSWTSSLPKEHWKKTHSKNIEPRIVNGEPATLGQFPWQAAVYLTASDGSWFCGGSIISEEWILTSAFCLDGAESAQIATGLVDLDGDVGTLSEASMLIIHEDYDYTTLANDLGLIKLSTPLSLDEYTAAIILATIPIDGEVKVQVSGWGTTTDDGTDVSSNLNVIDLITITNEECDTYYGTGSTTDGMVCTISVTLNVKSICNGDWGGPLVSNPHTNPVQVGVASWVSSTGCEDHYPTGFSKTAFYRDWITTTTGV